MMMTIYKLIIITRITLLSSFTGDTKFYANNDNNSYGK